MMARSGHGWRTLIQRTVISFLRDDCAEHAAALAYYAVFSLPPLLLVTVGALSAVMDRSMIVGRIYTEIQSTLGESVAQQVVEALVAAQRSQSQGSLPAALAIVALLFSATGAFSQLQSSLNRIWEVKPDPKQSEVRSFLVKRLISFGMVLSVAFLLMVSLLLSAALTAISGFAYSLLPAGLSAAFLKALTDLVSLAMFTGLFSAMFRLLPDAEIKASDSVAGGFVTSVLFTGGKALIGWYLGKSQISNAFGAAGSLALLLAWTYYASMIVLLGAEFTRVWAQNNGHRPVPEAGAVRVAQREVRIGKDETSFLLVESPE